MVGEGLLRILKISSRPRWRPRIVRRATAAIAVGLVALGLAAGEEVAPAATAARPDGGTTAGSGHEPTGCEAHPGTVAERGPAARRAVALTFDDGPSLTQTPAILAILNRLHARATFFEEGRHVRGREAVMRQIVASGDEIGNHSYDHPAYPGYGELAGTDRSIHAATGFEPCLFRPPYGLIDAKVRAAARRAHLELVLWTIDSGDDHHPGIHAIDASVLGSARPGSIVLMHDGGHHPQTVRALPAVIHGLQSRGFQLITVSALLGEHMRRAGL